MKKNQELTWEQLQHSYLPSDFSFKTTDELKCLDEIIGQERAKKAMEFGLSVKVQGYNIYMSGKPGTGKTTFAKVYAQKAASQKPTPSDWCYVYNFKQKRVPKALRFDPGDGRKFQDDMNELIEYLTKEIPLMYATKEHDKQKNAILSEHQDEKELYFTKLKNCASSMGFMIRIAKEGISFVPLHDNGKPMNEEEFDSLDKEKRKNIEDKSHKLQEITEDTLRYLREKEQKVIQKIEDLEYEIGLKGIGYYIKALKEAYQIYEEVVEYLDDVQQDMLDNIQVFIGEEEDSDSISSLFPWVAQKSIGDLVTRYKVNLLIDHSKTQGAPVIVDVNSTYSKIIGELEYDNEFGTLCTDFMKIKPGLFHKANGGYLILQADNLLRSYQTWEAIKQVLKTKQIHIENPQGVSVMTISTLKPEPIPMDVKVILVGDLQLYQLLYEYDPDFRKLFKIRADFDYEMNNNQKNVHLIARFIKNYCDEEFIPPFSAEAVQRVIQYGSRYVGNQEKITAEFSMLIDIIVEAGTLTMLEDAYVVEEKHVLEAIKQKEYRASRYEEKIDEQMMNNMIMIETAGSNIGQVNGLAVYGMGDYQFGKPIKITATTYKGQSGIINIEKEAKLSGAIHTKGTQVIAGYLGQTYAQNFPLSLSCRICFEQNYGGIDGDSASSAELYAILSSLADIPIKQNIAVTGSVNQHGKVQPIGGVTHKIEGFYKLCKKRGLTGDQGVIIPIQNVSDLVLKEEIITAVKEGKFHIYAISNIEEGIEIITGVPYDEIDEKIKQKLKKFYVGDRKKRK